MEKMVTRPSPTFWRGKRVLLTGHTGFKGAWMARMLAHLGAEVTGFGLDPVAGPSAFDALRVAECARDLRGDLRDAAAVAAGARGQDVTLHLAAQAIVGAGYADPVGTWESNVTGTLHLLQALRGSGAKAAIAGTASQGLPGISRGISRYTGRERASAASSRVASPRCT